MEFLQDGLEFDLFDDDETQETSGSLSASDSAVINDEPYLLRSNNYWQQVPVPTEVNLDGTNVLASFSDDDLMEMSPTLIAHVQRTEASGGVQVVSPRAITLGGVAGRTMESKRTTDMFLVGSAGSRNTTWPTMDNDPMEGFFWREPIDSYPNDPATRPKTVTSGILSSTRLIDDPITKAFLIGRALVDLQRRPDIAGSAEALSAALALCWDIEPEDYEDLGEASLAPVGELLRYAIRSDTSYPIVNAPIQARKCISVGANTAGRLLYGESAAIDWRRMRVLAESVFYQASRLEGHTLLEMITENPPGNPRSPPVRPGIIQMRPLPGSVWSFDSRSFRLLVDEEHELVPAVRMPDRVRAAVNNYHDNARPIAIAAASGAEISYSRTQVTNLISETAEGLVAGYKRVLTVSSTFSARGKTSSAAVRGFVYTCLSQNTSLSSIRALWLGRYMHETTEALNLTSLLDIRTTRHVAARMSDITTDMRSRLGVEAGKRGSDLDEWWADIAALLPSELKKMKEGSAAWAFASAHLMLHPPTDRWAKLVRAMGYASHEALARSHLTDIRLPARIGSPERTLAAAYAVTRQLGTSYGAYYRSMYDVSCILADRLKRAGNRHGAEKVKLAGMMWNIRAAAASTATLHTPDGTSQQAGSIPGKHTSYHLTVAPYDAYQRWKSAVGKSPVVSKDMKVTYPHHTPTVISSVFEGKTKALFGVAVGASCRLHRYVTDPKRLATDIERTLDLMVNDITRVVNYYDTENLIPYDDITYDEGEAIKPLRIDMSQFRPVEGSYWDVVSAMPQIEAADIVDAVTRMDDAAASDIENRLYQSSQELSEYVWGVVECHSKRVSKDAVH